MRRSRSTRPSTPGIRPRSHVSPCRRTLRRALRGDMDRAHAAGMRPTLYEHAGGADAMLRLATAHHARCLADAELNHPFSHPGNAEHVARLAAYWGEVLGGPPAYSALPDTGQSALLALHAGNGDMADLGRRFVACFIAAADDAG